LTFKRRFGKIPGLQRSLPIPQAPFEQISSDILGPFPVSSKGNRYIINAVCMLHTFKYIEIQPLKGIKTSDIIHFYEDRIFTKNSCPSIILTDRGSNYVSELYNAYNKFYGVFPRRICAYNSNGNSYSERINSQIHFAISTYVNYKCNNWDQYLNQFQFAYYSTRHKSHLYSSFFLLYSREPVFPSQFDVEEAHPALESK